MNLFCINIKNRHNTDIKCSSKATNGLYCSKHYKSPNPFYNYTTISKLQQWWKTYIKRKYYSKQGPARNNLSLANNTTEIYNEDYKRDRRRIEENRKTIANKNIEKLIGSMSGMKIKTKSIISESLKPANNKENESNLLDENNLLDEL